VNGFGLREQWAAGRSMRHQKLWRDGILLHQLTVNGSLLLIDNTDELWRRLLAPTLAQAPDAQWMSLRGLLRLLPAHLARRALWRTSRRWLLIQAAAQLAQHAHALHTGQLARVAATPEQQALTRRLERTAQMLDDLTWCDSATDDGTIAVADLREAQRQAAARKPKAPSVHPARPSVTP
jgi:hypothetical protein